jgi:hypothetical protein
MSTAAPRDVRDHDTLLPGAAAVAAFVMLAALAAPFSAQRAAAQSAPCTAIQDDAERLACYDRALRAAPPAAPLPTAPAAQAAPTVPPAQAAVQSSAPQSASAAVSAPAASPAPAATATPTQDADKQVVPVVIVGVRTLPGRETTFTAQDGAMWVQNDSLRVVGLPDTPFDAELKPGAMGSTFLVPKSGGRAIRVRLLER